MSSASEYVVYLYRWNEAVPTGREGCGTQAWMLSGVLTDTSPHSLRTEIKMWAVARARTVDQICVTYQTQNSGACYTYNNF